MVRAVIFDMDGLLVDSEPIWVRTWEIAFDKLGLEYLPEFKRACLGCNSEKIKGIIREFYPDRVEDALAGQREHERIGREWFLERGAPLKPGARELLAFLGERGIPCAVASSSPADVVNANLRHAGIDDRFPIVVTGDLGFPSKPDPAVFLAAAERLGVDPADAVVLEDSLAGVRAAHDGGFMPVMVPDLVAPTDEARSQAVAIVDTLAEVPILVERLS